ncbi:MAG: hypothetical protein JNK86_04640 [Alphaproteobacteria bacterium]|nr:hypothetical protein [Alphaproteobacteria bacterium]
MIKFPKPLDQMTDEEIIIFFRLNAAIEEKIEVSERVDDSVNNYKKNIEYETQAILELENYLRELKNLINIINPIVRDNKEPSHISIWLREQDVSLAEFLEKAMERKESIPTELVEKRQYIEKIKLKIKNLREIKN